MKKSLKSSDKLRLRSEFQYVRENGQKYVAQYCLLVQAPTPDQSLRCGVICGKKYSKRAVDRNRARRLLWESFRLLKQQIKPCHMVLIARKRIATAKQPEVQQEIHRLLKKASLLTTSDSP